MKKVRGIGFMLALAITLAACQSKQTNPTPAAPAAAENTPQWS
jgi:uncharacterized lipoprotein YbaY